MVPTLALINESSVVNDNDVQNALRSFQQQVTRDFTPIWGRDAQLTFVPKKQRPPSGSWWVVILDDSDQAGALGYHDLTSHGLPLSKVFARTDQKYHLNWTVTASHEILEMLGDPLINLSALQQSSAHQGRLYAYEACDAVEADELGYDIDGVTVSDFVTPDWFLPIKGMQYDFKGHLNAPFQLAKGGYIGYLDLSSSKGWQQKTNEDAPNRPMHPGSRRERRARGQERWSNSTAHE
jgi:hypothetical protein